MNGDRSVLSELLLGFMNLTDEFNERLSAARQTVIRPVSELELTHRARLTVLATTVYSTFTALPPHTQTHPFNGRFFHDNLGKQATERFNESGF